MASEVVELIHHYYRVVGDPRSTAADLVPLWHSDARIIEHPNVVTPRGTDRGPAEALAG